MGFELSHPNSRGKEGKGQKHGFLGQMAMRGGGWATEKGWAILTAETGGGGGGRKKSTFPLLSFLLRRGEGGGFEVFEGKGLLFHSVVF